MSISFNSIKGYNNKVNVGDMGYSNNKFDKNKIYSGGNPSNWNGNFKIKKDSNKGIHTRYIEKIGSEVLNNMNRENFEDRHYGNIQKYPSSRNIMATGVDYGGSTPYKIGDSSKTCKFNMGNFITNSQEYALSRKPIQHITASTNKKSDGFIYNQNHNPNLKAINENYSTTYVQSNKMIENFDIQQNRNPMHKFNSKINTNTNTNLTKLNNYNNISDRRVDNKNLSENYQMVNVNTNKKTYETDNMNRNIDNKVLSDNYRMVNVNTNKKSNDIKYNNKNINPENYIRNGTLITNVNTNLSKNYNELEQQRYIPKIQQTLNINNSYMNNRTGIRQQTKNIEYKL